MLRSCFASAKLAGGARLLGKGECFSTQKILALNDLSHNEGAVQKVSWNSFAAVWSLYPNKLLACSTFTEKEMG